jgi:hypothetical protein
LQRGYESGEGQNCKTRNSELETGIGYAADLAEANKKKVSIRWQLWVDKNDVLGEALEKGLEKHGGTDADDDEGETGSKDWD